MNFDFSSCGGLMQRHLDWLTGSGVPMSAIIRPEPMRLAHGFRAADSRFDHDPSSPAWLAFPEPEDCVFWEPRTGLRATAVADVISPQGPVTMGVTANGSHS
ncbi:hypothetical protein [Rhizobium sp. H4]|uniref:hypothetical protein n=1 Tax=Rhizobium sp. H4 TaxID=2035449 RepID=UPI00131C2CF8|nr:hypothetical protein [Rhizobium sp. H4]